LQVIDNVCSKNFDLVLIGKGLGFLGDSDIECEDRGKLLLLTLLIHIKSFHSLQNVILVDWSDSDIAHWDFLVEQELKQGF